MEPSASPTSFFMLSLPIELIIAVYDKLDFRSILVSRAVSRLLCSIIDSSTVLQYKIELAVAGKEDGPYSSLSISERLAKLKEYQRSWDKLTLPETRRFRTNRGVWELYYNVLAEAVPKPERADSVRTLTFRRLPAPHRGIPEKQWTLKDVGFNIRDFTMDPSQDLLAVIESAGRIITPIPAPRRVHVLSLTSGKRHPSVIKSEVLSCTLGSASTPFVSYSIKISGTYLGLMCLPGRVRQRSLCTLTIWNWKTSAVQLTLEGPNFRSFAFLTDRHVMMANVGREGPDSLCVYDFLDLGETNPAPMTKFLLPDRARNAETWDVTIHSDPQPLSTPHPDLPVPFYCGQGNRIFVITFTVFVHTRGDGLIPLNIFIPLSTLLHHLAKEPLGCHTVTWPVWGPSGSRLVPSTTFEPVWVCYVQAMKYVQAVGPLGPEGRFYRFQLIDFNPLALRRAQVADEETKRPSGNTDIEGEDDDAESREVEEYEEDFSDDDEDEPACGTEMYWTESHIRGGEVFAETVTTRLPFKVTTANTPYEFDAVMLTEDHLVTIDTTHGEFGVFTL